MGPTSVAMPRPISYRLRLEDEARSLPGQPATQPLAGLVGTFLATVSVQQTMPTFTCDLAAPAVQEILASGSTTIFRYRGNVTPRDRGRWAIRIRTLVERWLRLDAGDDVNRWCAFVQGLRRAGFTGGWL